ncbi:MAG: Crp/Fnr family transcriptional regulator [Rikenellaceae bacterium]|nr:Crp/Fnr family transcriptional regulator [Rikenellaceae bacterium]
MKKIYDILTGCPLFRGMTSKDIECILTRDDVSVSEYSTGQLIAQKDTAYSGLMIILTGSAEGVFVYPSGQKSAIETLSPGELISPAFLFGGYNRLPVDVVAAENTSVLTLHRGLLFELMQDYTLILSNFIDIISNRAGVWQKRIYALSYKTLREKLASYLLDHTQDGSAEVPVPDIKEIADYFSATRSSLLSVIEGMEKKHLIESDGRVIRILNRCGLEEVLK